jgi:hypothetical protein
MDVSTGNAKDVTSTTVFLPHSLGMQKRVAVYRHFHMLGCACSGSGQDATLLPASQDLFWTLPSNATEATGAAVRVVLLELFICVDSKDAEAGGKVITESNCLGEETLARTEPRLF